IFQALPMAVEDGENLKARQTMHDASCLAGMSFSNALLGIVHSLSHQIGGMFDVPHGRANAILLPNVIRFNAMISVADHSAPGHQQPTITQTASGIPQVNIQTPSAGGVSHNTYSQFDVSNQGVILNNSHNNVQTQLGGTGKDYETPQPARTDARYFLSIAARRIFLRSPALNSLF
ncbi:iron-containing alcohol dehydrogenase, partial [Escherichia coli]